MLTNLETAISADMNLNVDERAVVLAPLKGVTRVCVLLVKTVRGSTV